MGICTTADQFFTVLGELQSPIGVKDIRIDGQSCTA
jgi:hypothetical protein